MASSSDCFIPYYSLISFIFTGINFLTSFVVTKMKCESFDFLNLTSSFYSISSPYSIAKSSPHASDLKLIYARLSIFVLSISCFAVYKFN